MNDDLRDILDLCRLNQMEDNCEDDELKKAIAWKQRQIASRIKHNQPPVSQDVLGKHITENTVDGVYLGDWDDPNHPLVVEMGEPKEEANGTG